jgi:2-dehydro-3-deoxygluconokinase
VTGRPVNAPAAVCIGESMAVLVPDRAGPLEHAERFRRGVGGAESNVACGLAALGVPAAWISRVGDDGFGRLLLAELAARGVDTSAVEIDPRRPTGLYVKEIGAGGGLPHDLGAGNSRLHYYRTGSAASALGPSALLTPAAGALLAEARLVHLSGITAALGRLSGHDGGQRLVEAVLERRTGGGPMVSFDLNWRPRVWQGPDDGVGTPAESGTPAPAETLARLAARADVVLLGTDEAVEVFGTDDPRRLRALLPGPRHLVVKDSGHGATAFDGEDVVTEPALRVEVVEPIGAGDAFASGFLAGLLLGYDAQRRLRLGHLCAAAVLMVPGDHAAPPPPDTLAALLDGPPSQWATIRASGGVYTIAQAAAS